MSDGSAGSSPDCNKMAATMVSQWRSRNAQQVRRITQAVENNLELQMLVLSTVEHYERSKDLAAQKGTSVAELAKRKSKDKIDDEVELEIKNPGEAIGKGRLAYKSWPKSWLQELLSCMVRCPFKKIAPVKDKQKLLQMLEYATDVQCAGDPDSDKVKHPSITKQDAFDRLCAVHAMKDSRLTNVIEKIQDDGHIDWETAGHYQIVPRVDENGLTVIDIWCGAVKKKATMDAETLQDDPGPYTVKFNFSLAKAVLSTAKETYSLQNFFPMMSRTLKRKISDVLGVVGGQGASGRPAIADASPPPALPDGAPPPAEGSSAQPPPPSNFVTPPRSGPRMSAESAPPSPADE